MGPAAALGLAAVAALGSCCLGAGLLRLLRGLLLGRTRLRAALAALLLFFLTGFGLLLGFRLE